MSRQIDRLLDNAYLAKQLGCRESADYVPQGCQKIISDADLREFFSSNKTRVLCQAMFRDGEYTIHWASKPLPSKVVKKKVAKKKSVKKKAARPTD